MWKIKNVDYVEVEHTIVFSRDEGVKGKRERWEGKRVVKCKVTSS
jgi:hypothetical protein